MKRFLGVVIMLITFCTIARAQDPHFSLFYQSPMTLNPALTGVIECNYRISGIYRGQWQSILRSNNFDRGGTPLFRTYSVSADMRTRKGFGDGDAVGIGLMFLGDKAGAADFGTNIAGLSLSYIKALDPYKGHYISAGINVNVGQRTINSSKLCFGTHYDGSGCNQDLPTDPAVLAGFDNNFFFYDISAGLLWFIQPSKRSNIFVGAAVFHVNTPNESFFRTGTNVTADVPMKIVGHAGIKVPLAQKIDLLPKLVFLQQSKQWETNFGTDIKFFFDKNEPNGNAFYVGAQYRLSGGDPDEVWVDQAINSESVIVSTRVDYGQVSFSAAYDLNLGEVAEPSRTVGGFELAATLNGCFRKKGPKTITCPRF